MLVSNLRDSRAMLAELESLTPRPLR
jgi:hypothetical protein